jgi:hypothetical protein
MAGKKNRKKSSRNVMLKARRTANARNTTAVVDRYRAHTVGV